MKKVEKLMLPLLKSIRRIGQTQLIRRQIANLLQFECQLDAFQLHQSLLAFDRGLMNDITNHYRNPEKPYPDPATGNPLLFETTSLLEACGLDDPLHKIYVTSVPLEGLPQLLFLFLLTYIPKVTPFSISLSHFPPSWNTMRTLEHFFGPKKNILWMVSHWLLESLAC